MLQKQHKHSMCRVDIQPRINLQRICKLNNDEKNNRINKDNHTYTLIFENLCKHFGPSNKAASVTPT